MLAAAPPRSEAGSRRCAERWVQGRYKPTGEHTKERATIWNVAYPTLVLGGAAGEERPE